MSFLQDFREEFLRKITLKLTVVSDAIRASAESGFSSLICFSPTDRALVFLPKKVFHAEYAEVAEKEGTNLRVLCVLRVPNLGSERRTPEYRRFSRGPAFKA